MGSPPKETFKIKNFLKTPSYKEILKTSNINPESFNKIDSQIFLICEGVDNPLFILEVQKERAKFINNSLLMRLPPFTINLPSYHVYYSRLEGNTTNLFSGFCVKKCMPKERFIGTLDSRSFVKFLAATLLFCRRKNETTRSKDQPQPKGNICQS